jgi:hypothetical protein
MQLFKNSLLSINRLARLGLAMIMVLVINTAAVANDTSIQKSIFDVMSYNDVISVTLESKINYFKENKRSKDELDSKFTYINEDGESIDLDVKLTIRGKYRRMFSEGVPPLKLNFKKKDLKKLGLSSFDDFKLVTMFHDDKGEAYQTLVKEYLAYKAYNLLSEYSYRVQMVEVTYKDVDSGDSEKEYAFLIEDSAQLAERIGAKKINDINDVPDLKMNEDNLALVSMFQYMIGNGDWGYEIVKNLNLFEKDGEIICIPYDFDFSGLVDASYAVPNNIYKIKSVRDRVYLGKNVTLNNLEPVLNIFIEKKENLIDLVESCNLLSRKNRNEASEYLNSFYSDISFRKANNYSMRDTLAAIAAKK